MNHNPLEAMVRRVLPGDGDVELHPLGAGVVNRSWRAERAGRCYAVRIGTELEARGHSPALWLDRGWECRVLAAASAAGLAPRVLVCDVQLGLLVTEWVDGEAWSASHVQTSENIHVVAHLLRRVHGLKVAPPTRAMMPRDWISLYATTVPKDPRLAAIANGRLEYLGKCAPLSAVLCHSDLHRFNVVGDATPVLIDWEYAHMNDPYWDLAGWIANNDGSAEFASALAQIYLQRRASDAETARLCCMVWLYDYVCLLWSEVYMAATRAPDASVAIRARRLAERLMAGTLDD